MFFYLKIKMIAEIGNLQIVLNGAFKPYYVEKTDIISLSGKFSNFLLYPKEVTEQRIEFNPTTGNHNVSVQKSYELVSPNQKCTLQIREDVLSYSYKLDLTDSLDDVINRFIEVLSIVEFEKCSRLGAVLVNQFYKVDFNQYKIDNKLDNNIIEYSKKNVIRTSLDSIAELVNFVQVEDYYAKESGAPLDIISKTFDINTLRDKDAARFTAQEIKNFLYDARNFFQQ